MVKNCCNMMSLLMNVSKSARAEADKKIENKKQATIEMIQEIVHESFQSAEQEETMFDFKFKRLIVSKKMKKSEKYFGDQVVVG